MTNTYVVVLVTCASRTEARTIVEALVRKRFIACGTILPPVVSVFRWKGKVECAREYLLLAKTRRQLFDRVATEVRRLHSYEVPEIIALPVSKGHRPYLTWIQESCKPGHSRI